MVQPPDGDMPAALNPRLVRALEHPVRVKFLALLSSQDRLSPAEALPLMNSEELALSNVTYHARVLDQFELVEATADSGPTGGAAFRVTPKGETALAALGLPREENGS
jgi:hypothetical protein